MGFVKVGDKQKHVQIPEGYELLPKGCGHVGRKYDQFCSVRNYKWTQLDPDEMGQDVDWMEVVIRPTPELLRKWRDNARRNF